MAAALRDFRALCPAGVAMRSAQRIEALWDKGSPLGCERTFGHFPVLSLGGVTEQREVAEAAPGELGRIK